MVAFKKVAALRDVRDVEGGVFVFYAAIVGKPIVVSVARVCACGRKGGRS